MFTGPSCIMDLGGLVSLHLADPVPRVQWTAVRSLVLWAFQKVAPLFDILDTFFEGKSISLRQPEEILNLYDKTPCEMFFAESLEIYDVAGGVDWVTIVKGDLMKGYQL
jgi:hypothetical protein